MRLSLPLSTRRTAPLLLIAATLFALPSAHAMRPFDGTDAAVAEQGMFELEMGAAYLRQTGGRVRTLPGVVANFGVWQDTELTLETSSQTQIDHTDAPYRTGMNDTQISMKHVLRRGGLQEGGHGVSVALECALQLPNYHGEHNRGAGCTALASQSFNGVVMHFDAGVERDQEHAWGHIYDVIAESPEAWPLRPVMELSRQATTGEPSTRAALVGLLWKAGEELAFDVALRRACIGVAHLTEVRFGLTWGFKPGRK
jgi:hypothetical protein